MSGEKNAPPIKRKPGRPRKNATPAAAAAAASRDEQPAVPKRKRGRPPKKKETPPPPPLSSESEDEESSGKSEFVRYPGQSRSRSPERKQYAAPEGKGLTWLERQQSYATQEQVSIDALKLEVFKELSSLAFPHRQQDIRVLAAKGSSLMRQLAGSKRQMEELWPQLENDSPELRDSVFQLLEENKNLDELDTLSLFIEYDDIVDLVHSADRLKRTTRGNRDQPRGHVLEADKVGAKSVLSDLPPRPRAK